MTPLYEVQTDGTVHLLILHNMRGKKKLSKRAKKLIKKLRRELNGTK